MTDASAYTLVLHLAAESSGPAHDPAVPHLLHPGVPVIVITVPPADAPIRGAQHASNPTPAYEALLQAHGRELTAAVATIARADGPVLVHSDLGAEFTGLVVVLALLAAGAGGSPDRRGPLPHPDVREGPQGFWEADFMPPAGEAQDVGPASSRLTQAFAVLDEFGGVEPYLLHHGLTVGDFHALRDTLASLQDAA